MSVGLIVNGVYRPYTPQNAKGIFGKNYYANKLATNPALPDAYKNYLQCHSASGSGVGAKVYPVTFEKVPKGCYICVLSAASGDPDRSASNPYPGWNWNGPLGKWMYGYSTVKATRGTVNAPIQPRGHRVAAWGAIKWGCMFEVTSDEADVTVDVAAGSYDMAEVRYYMCTVLIAKIGG